MPVNDKKPIVIAIAGPNGSGKTTVTKDVEFSGTYVNADDIKAVYGLSDMVLFKRRNCGISF